MYEDMALWLEHTMSSPQTHVFETGPQTDRATLGDPRNFMRVAHSQRKWVTGSGSLGFLVGGLVLVYFLSLCPPRTKEQLLLPLPEHRRPKVSVLNPL